MTDNIESHRDTKNHDLKMLNQELESYPISIGHVRTTKTTTNKVKTPGDQCTLVLVHKSTYCGQSGS